jgi:hypothetical protein
VGNYIPSHKQVLNKLKLIIVTIKCHTLYRGKKNFSDCHLYNLVEWALDKRLRCLIFAAEAKVLGHGGIIVVVVATGISRWAIHAGLKELESRQTNERTIGSCIR